MSRWMGRCRSFQLNQKCTLAALFCQPPFTADGSAPPENKWWGDCPTANSQVWGFQWESKPLKHHFKQNPTQRPSAGLSKPSLCSVLWKLRKVRRGDDCGAGKGWFTKSVWERACGGGNRDSSTEWPARAHLDGNKQSSADDGTGRAGNVATLMQ